MEDFDCETIDELLQDAYVLGEDIDDGVYDVARQFADNLWSIDKAIDLLESVLGKDISTNTSPLPSPDAIDEVGILQ